MQAMVTRLSFSTPEAAEAELEELRSRADSIAEVAGFRALYGIRAGPAEILIVRVFDTAQGIGQSLAGPLRPDLATQFSQPPLRMTGEVVIEKHA